MLWLIAALIFMLACAAWSATGHLLNIANALKEQNKHYGIGVEAPVVTCEFCENPGCTFEEPCPDRHAAIYGRSRARS